MTAIKKYIYRELTIEQRKGAGLLCGWGRKEGGKEGWGGGIKHTQVKKCLIHVLY